MATIDILKKQEQARQLRYSRSKFRRINSLDLIPEDPGQDPFSQTSGHNKKVVTLHRSQALRKPSRTISTTMRQVLFFWPQLLLNITFAIIRFIFFLPLSIAAPSFWLSALLWIFWKFVRIPVALVKWILNVDSLMEVSSEGPQRHRRTVLISCGSTIQTLHLARNFYASGSRVVVFEFEGLFGLARFSTAVDKFYIVPKPSPNNVDNYISALCHIVSKEKPSVYIPVCATSPAYYDALAKQHLELLGCASFIPGFTETKILDDCLEFFKKCTANNISVPPYSELTSPIDLHQLYENNFISNFRNILMAVGFQGLVERFKYLLPNNRMDFKFNHEISENDKWIVIRDLPGEHYITCTTVKDSRVVSNVTCKVEHETKNLIPITPINANGPNIMSDEAQIDIWLKTFFAKVRFQRSINGHMSFRLIKNQGTTQFIPLGVRVGVSLPYICYNRSHAQILCRTMKCIHRRQLSFTSPDEESALGALTASFRWSSIERSTPTTVLDKREALFAYWDPLPYCAYYHFQLPLKSVKMFLQKRHRSSKTLSPRITMPVH
ncbi:uncharacterized protein LOC101463375 [Ceratitis capitata]|uniref:(Mediterranean fruit fly) hypothetical protein n=1 Tax=Ceratitis capitata TaxID=7213 RepID=W8C8N6_CERCA|nr:uncharacterized protein LOC101463375 [Ceratitis capitata]CAD6993895.1 unnamed protein product [Ceratitis capitata]